MREKKYGYDSHRRISCRSYNRIQYNPFFDGYLQSKPFNMELLETVDEFGNRCEFRMQVVDEEDEIKVRVFEVSGNDLEWYDHIFKMRGDHFQSTEMSSNYYKQFRRKGIPEAVIERISRDRGITILSSPKNPRAGDYLVGPSYKVWQRLNQKYPKRCTETTERFVIKP
jgi:hypothetical protein